MAEVVRAELRDLGAEVHEDDAAAALPAGCGNIVGRFAPTAEGGVPIMFGAHLDTVPVTGADRGRAGRRPPHQPPRRDPRRRQQVGGRGGARGHAPGRRARGAPTPGVELVFTPCEEIGLRGAHAVRPAARCGPASASSTTTRARWGTSWPPRPRCTASAPPSSGAPPTPASRPRVGPQRDPGRRAGDRAHAARAHRRRDDRQHRHDRGRHRDQRRSPSAAPSRPRPAAATSAPLSVQLTAMLDALTWAASECEVDLETRVEKRVHRLPRSARATPRWRWPWPCSPALGHTPRLVPSGGGSDVNAFIRNGFPAVNLCNGMIDVHTADERIAVGEPGADGRRHPRPDRRGARRRDVGDGGLGPPIRTERIHEGDDRQPAPLRLPAARRHRRHPRGHGPPRRRRDGPGRGRPRADGAPAARGGARSTPSSCRPGKLDHPGEDAARTAPARAGRGGRLRGGGPGATSAASTRRPRSSPSSSTASWRATCRPWPGRSPPTRTRRSRSSRGRSPTSGRLIDKVHDAKSADRPDAPRAGAARLLTAGRPSAGSSAGCRIRPIPGLA